MLRGSTLALFLLASCGDGGGGGGGGSGGPVPKGARILGIHVDDAEDGNYDAAVALAQSFGAQSVPHFFTWPMIETAPMTYDSSLLDLINIYYPPKGLQVSLTVAPINTNVTEVPPDLAGRAWDDPVMISRFNAMQDFLFSRIPAITLPAYAIGNEVDAALASPADYAAFKAFFAATKAHAQSLRPGLKVGVTAQWAGLTGPSSGLLADLNQAADFVSVTYYGIDAGFAVKPPAAVRSDFDALLAIYPSAPVYVQECGYPSSTLLGSSEQAQSDFVREVFLMWDARAAQIPLLYFFKLTDWSQAEVDAIAAHYGGSASTPFKEFLRTLGLRAWPGSGSDKPGFTALRTEAAARGW